MNRKILGRVAQWVGGMVAAGILLATIRSALREMQSHSDGFSLPFAVLATVLLAATYLGFAALWREIAVALGTRVPYLNTVQLWSFSNLGRYLPGKVWQVIGLVVIARDLGVPPGVATAVSVVALGFMITSGALVGVLLLPGLFAEVPWARWLCWVVGAGTLVPLVRPGIVGTVLRRLPASLGCRQVRSFSRATAAKLVALFLITWLVQGLTFLILAQSFGPIEWLLYPRFAGAYALAYVIGLAAIFAPGGIGVREVLLAHLLGDLGPSGLPTHALAVAARLWTLCGELLVLLFAIGLRVFRAKEER